jgi:hypothetical protein
MRFKLAIAVATALFGLAALSAPAMAETVLFNQGTLSTGNSGNNYFNDAGQGYPVENASTYYIDFTVPSSASLLSIYTDIVTSLGGANFSAAPFALFSGTVTCNNPPGCTSLDTSAIKLADLISPKLGSTPFAATYSVGKAGSGSYVLAVSPTFDAGTLQGNFQIDHTPSVPEPATWAMMMLGLGMLGLAARRRRDAAFA